jgi:RNA polymerase sigma-70 factor (ECF subfamily)
VLTLYYFDDMKYTDIADVLGIPLNTVKSHIRRGKERLAAIMQLEGQPPAARSVVPAKPERKQASIINPFIRLAPLRAR